MVLLDELSREAWEGRVEFVDGGTQGLALLGRLGGRRSLLILDAIALGAEPGTVHVLDSPDLSKLDVRSTAARSTTAHESSATELLRFAALLGELPEHVVLAGIEPDTLTTGIGLSARVAAAIPAAAEKARTIVSKLLLEKEPLDVPCHTR
jgi:hydrogenase maturation protease